MKFVVMRMGGPRAQLHVAVMLHGALLTACGRKLPGSAVRVGRGAWDEDDAMRCLTCSRKTSVVPSTRSRRPVR